MSDQDRKYIEVIEAAWKKIRESKRLKSEEVFSDATVVLRIAKRGVIILDVMGDSKLYDRLLAYCQKQKGKRNVETRYEGNLGTIIC